MKKLEEFVDKSLKNFLDKSDMRVHGLRYILAREYLYPSYAEVCLSEPLEELITKAKEVYYDERENAILVDGIRYSWEITKEASRDYLTAESDEEFEEMYNSYVNESGEIIKEFLERQKKELLAILENSNDDFEVTALFEFFIVS